MSFFQGDHTTGIAALGSNISRRAPRVRLLLLLLLLLVLLRFAVNFPLLNKLFMAFMPKIFGQTEQQQAREREREVERKSTSRMKDDDE